MAEETHWREEAERRTNPKKKVLYESIADVAALKVDELRLRANVRPEGEVARSILEEEAENNDLTRFERFKRWARRNLGGISIMAMAIAVGARNAAKKGASATSKLAKTLGKIAEKAGPVLSALRNLAAGILKLGAKAVGFLSENLWLLAVMIAYALYDQYRRPRGSKGE